ncbi:hypothetical protein D3C84_1045970 [compost metagenome]
MVLPVALRPSFWLRPIAASSCSILLSLRSVMLTLVVAEPAKPIRVMLISPSWFFSWLARLSRASLTSFIRDSA